MTAADIPPPSDPAPVQGPVPAPAAAGSSLVDDVVARLGRLGDVPLVEHPDVYQSIHADLQSALAAIDDA